MSRDCLVNLLAMIDKSKDDSGCKGCPYFDRSDLRCLPAVKVPPPERIGFLIISDRPTISFEQAYNRSVDMKADEKRPYLFHQAMIGPLVDQIRIFASKDAALRALPIDDLCKAILDEAYWTHVEKCITADVNARSICFGKWLRRELECLSDMTSPKGGFLKAIIVLGRVPQRKLQNQWEGIEVIYFPPPAGQGLSHWYGAEKHGEIARNISKLVALL